MIKQFVVVGLLAVSAVVSFSTHAEPNGKAGNVVQKPAAKFAHPERNQILAATQAGGRVVAVGDRGVVLLSDDKGATYRQAKHVPTRATLTAVSFVDEKAGWAVGHWGVILNTEDGGETWSLQRDDLASDQPLFTVWFKDAQNGVAAGLFSLLLTTSDGGKTWSPVRLPSAAGNRSVDINLFSIFPDRQGNVLLTGEQGMVYRSKDGGNSWEAMPTGSKGTFWAGLVLDDGTIIVAGLRGNVYRSQDGGASWARTEASSNSSVTGMVQLPNADLVLVGMDGLTLISKDRGATFTAQNRSDQASLTAVVSNASGVPLFFSLMGVVKGK